VSIVVVISNAGLYDLVYTRLGGFTDHSTAQQLPKINSFHSVRANL